MVGSDATLTLWTSEISYTIAHSTDLISITHRAHAVVGDLQSFKDVPS